MDENELILTTQESILLLTKKLLGLEREYRQFDVDVIIGINSALSTLNQLGIGPKKGFILTDESQTWKDFLGNRSDIESVKTFVYLSTRLMFDPPQNSFLVENIKSQLNEITWRLSVQEIPVEPEPDDPDDIARKVWYNFNSYQWNKIASKYRLIIPLEEHNVMLNPVINKILNQHDENVELSWEVRPNGDLVLTSDAQFSGKILII